MIQNGLGIGGWKVIKEIGISFVSAIKARPEFP